MANLGYGSSGSDVRELQNALIAAGYDVGSTGADGIFGAKTQAAVKQYQQDNGLSVDGIAGELTQGSLYNTKKEETPSYSPSYSSWGDSTYKALLQQAIGMNYDDWTKGDHYKSLAARYGDLGKMSMQDVLGQVASRTGGLASSYATTAAHQQYNNWMAQLEEVARAMYADERDDLIENASLAKGYADYEHSRYLDQLQLLAASGSGGGSGGGYSGGDTSVVDKVMPLTEEAKKADKSSVNVAGAVNGLLGPALAAARGQTGGGNTPASVRADLNEMKADGTTNRSLFRDVINASGLTYTEKQELIKEYCR